MNVETRTNKDGRVYMFLRGKEYKNGQWVNVKSTPIGYVDEFTDQYDDPVKHFKDLYRAKAKEQKEQARRDKEKEKSAVSITLDLDEKLEAGSALSKNIGYVAFKRYYKKLQLDKFWKSKTKNLDIEYDFEKAFYLMVISRLMDPGSKKYTFERKDQYFEPIDGFKLEDMYKALDIIAKYENELQQWIFHKSKDFIDRDTSVCYYDGTNYYFDIAHPDIDEIDSNGKVTEKKLRKRGPEKNHRPDPIVSMGLLLDKNGLPVSYTLYPGNESEKIHMTPALQTARNGQMIGKIINVADRGLNTSENIWHLAGANDNSDSGKDGYVFGKSVRGADQKFKDWVLSGGYETVYLDPDKMYSEDEDIDDTLDGKVKFKYKVRNEVVRLYVHVEMPDGTVKIKRPKTAQRQMVYYSEKYAKKQKRERQIMIERAKDLIAHPKKYDRVTAAGSGAYIKNYQFNKETGEITSKNLVLDEEKIAEEEKYDGYYAIVTSELDMPATEMRNIYRGLIRIEHTFRITKSEMETRPVFVWTTEHIKAHFSTCYTSLCLLKFLMYQLDNKYSAARILKSLKQCNVSDIDYTYWQFTHYDEILSDIEKLFDIDLQTRNRTREQLRRLLKY